MQSDQKPVTDDQPALLLKPEKYGATALKGNQSYGWILSDRWYSVDGALLFYERNCKQKKKKKKKFCSELKNDAMQWNISVFWVI